MAKRRPRLVTVGACLSEMGKLYREAREGTLAWIDAGIGVRILREIRATIDDSEFEQRLRALEAERGITRPNGAAKPNGNGHAVVYQRHHRPS